MNTSMVVFGATGDLAHRLLYPALARLDGLERLDDLMIAATGLEKWSSDRFVGSVAESVAGLGLGPTEQRRFLERFTYYQGDLSPEAVAGLEPSLADSNVYYLALPPGLFPKAARGIADSGITRTGEHRLVVEKPFGTSGESAALLEAELHEFWAEEQIFRIDHFLGKETVQNLSVLRFANRVIEPLLCATHVDQVQITVAETLGVEDRYRYYDGIGAMRDMIQNHLMQLFCLAAMDAPAAWDAEILRDHKVEVLRSVRPDAQVAGWAARGQYSAGVIDGVDVPSYLEEPGIEPNSTTETFAAVRLQVDNWRWQGVPFYLRSGKRLGSKLSEIAYRFREPPTQLFAETSLATAEPNWLVLRLNDPEGIDLTVQTKAPGLEMVAEPSRLHADYGSGEETVSAYEQLLLDILEGDHTPFLRCDEVAAAWRLLDPVLEAWRSGRAESYPSGSDGPTSADSILLDGHRWRPIG